MNLFFYLPLTLFLFIFLLIHLVFRNQEKKRQDLLTSQFYDHFKSMLLEQRQLMDQRQIENMKSLQENIVLSQQDIRQQIYLTLNQNTQHLTQQYQQLQQLVEHKLNLIGERVDQKLQHGFEKTTATFTDVVKRLAIIDEAQKRITELSSSVVSLQDILNDKKARGAFGEVQLSALIRNVMPEKTYEFQYQLTNGKRADCVLFLPEPTGNLVIDAKFPLENYRKMFLNDIGDAERKKITQLFRQDLKKHIHDIQSKYLIPGETSDGALLFIPAESIFAEIHAQYSDIVEEAFKKRVWFASPTTLMAILTTARAAIKDADTRKQVHVIQEHLSFLSKDFERFQKRMDNLARHIELASTDVKEVHISASKISDRFNKIERVELCQISNLAELTHNDSI